MDRVKNNFSIKNLEHLSGIKAHTIRIWEKRYNLFEPERTNTNIRLYNLENLQKLLNVTLLYNKGYKISKIASLSPHEINENVHKLTINKNADDWSTMREDCLFALSALPISEITFFAHRFPIPI